MNPNDPIEYRWLNMDNTCYTTQERLQKYAAAFRGGVHRTVATDAVLGGPVLMAYGTSTYTYDDMVALDKRLADNGEASR